MVTFYKCNTCGNQVVKIEDGGGMLSCCGKAMEQLVPGTTDGALEKHVPVVVNEYDCCCFPNDIQSDCGEKNCGKENDNIHRVQIQVGKEMHPSTDIHHIEWIAVETLNTFQIRSIAPGDEPIVDFYIKNGEKIHAIYAYCNLHGLWEGSLSESYPTIF